MMTSFIVSSFGKLSKMQRSWRDARSSWRNCGGGHWRGPEMQRRRSRMQRWCPRMLQLPLEAGPLEAG